METRANYFIVGVFVLGVLGLLLGFIYWTKNDASGSSGRNYAVIFDGSVQGLAESSPVLFNGIRFGAVRTIELMPEDTRKVRVLITIRDETPVRANSHARISHQGLAGLVAMEITPGTPDAAMLQVKQGEQYPVIYADPGSGSFLTGMADAASQANALAARLNNLVANNEDSIRHTITNLESFSTMMADRKDDVAASYRMCAASPPA
jgi:phospholipid/cholesterol/gamma-HCH transport system substrate-binding protein